MNARSYKVGCAVAEFDGKEDYVGWRNTYIVCNYSFSSISDIEIYKVGKAATQCKFGPDPKYPQLCLPPDQAPKKIKPKYPLPFNNPDQEHYCKLEKELCFDHKTNSVSKHVGCESDGVGDHENNWFPVRHS